MFSTVALYTFLWYYLEGKGVDMSEYRIWVYTSWIVFTVVVCIVFLKKYLVNRFVMVNENSFKVKGIAAPINFDSIISVDFFRGEMDEVNGSYIQFNTSAHCVVKVKNRKQIVIYNGYKRMLSEEGSRCYSFYTCLQRKLDKHQTQNTQFEYNK